jgi:putative ABC transport system ATP-binding protein
VALLEIRNISKIYDNEGAKTEALSGVDLSIEKGEFVAVMGNSGSGKSTLLHIAGLLDNLTGGTYHFAGKNISTYNQIEIAKIRNQKMGFIFQAFNLLPHATVLENVKLPLMYSDKPESEWNEIARKVAVSVGLESRLNHQAFQLSGGEKQRVAIARALVNNPEVIFADEPTGNLDSKSGAQVMKILQDLNDQGHTIILVTHEKSTAEHAERIIRLKDGIILDDSKVAQRQRAGGDILNK